MVHAMVEITTLKIVCILEPAFNTPECKFDGSDCTADNDKFDADYLGCDVEHKHCHRIKDDTYDGALEASFNTQECKFDGGNCNDWNVIFTKGLLKLWSVWRRSQYK